MPVAFSPALRAAVKESLENGKKDKVIIEEHKISAKKVAEMRKLWKASGEVWQFKEKKRTGPKPMITPEHEQSLRQYLDSNPNAYMKDMTNFLVYECGLEIDESTVYRTVQRLGWNIGRPKRQNLRDERGQWLRTLPRDGEGKAIRGVWERKEKKKFASKPGPKRSRGGPQGPKKSKSKALIARAHAFVKEYMSQPKFDASHNFDHVLRVVKMAKHILQVERVANPQVYYDPVVVELAALMHDVDDHKYREPVTQAFTNELLVQNEHPQNDSPDDHTSPFSVLQNLPPNDQSAAAQSNQRLPFLTPFPTSASSHPPVLTHLLHLATPLPLARVISTITSHISYSAEISHPSLTHQNLLAHPELAIVQDADRLDALGAIGIARTFTHGGARGRELTSTIAHFDEKLERLESMMKTGEGRRLARERTERLAWFRGWWEEEAGGGGLQGQGARVRVRGADRWWRMDG